MSSLYLPPTHGTPQRGSGDARRGVGEFPHSPSHGRTWLEFDRRASDSSCDPRSLLFFRPDSCHSGRGKREKPRAQRAAGMGSDRGPPVPGTLPPCLSHHLGKCTLVYIYGRMHPSSLSFHFCPCYYGPGACAPISLAPLGVRSVRHGNHLIIALLPESHAHKQAPRRGLGTLFCLFRVTAETAKNLPAGSAERPFDLTWGEARRIGQHRQWCGQG